MWRCTSPGWRQPHSRYDYIYYYWGDGWVMAVWMYCTVGTGAVQAVQVQGHQAVRLGEQRCYMN